MPEEQTAYARYCVLRDLMTALSDVGARLEEVAEYVGDDEGDVLRACADALQRVRACYWPRYPIARAAWEAERG